MLPYQVSSLHTAARAARRLRPRCAATYAQVASQHNFVRIVEVGPRDGLQNEKSVVPMEVKVELIERLQQAGLSIIESGSFVSPKWVPQMAGTAEVLTGVKQRQSVRYPVLVPNVKGLENLLSLLHSQPGADRSPPLTNEIAIFTAASESFCKTNTNKSITESLDTLAKVTERALSAGLLVRGYISTVDTCPFEGRVDPVKVKEIAVKLREMGCYEISLGDTVGTAVPATVTALIDEVVKQVDVKHLAGHYHDTFGMGTANVIAAVSAGIRVIDSSVAGLGGCPYSPGATGNVATEDVNHALTGAGYSTGINTDILVETGEWISKKIGRMNESRAGRAWLAKRQREHSRENTSKL
ncbi:aldolase [Ramaria rubella]|nr:aldolase [Ramaria rubella]